MAVPPTEAPVSTEAASEATTGDGGPAPSAAVRAKLPDVCGLINDATAAAAMGSAAETKGAPQPPTDISARCEWTSGPRSISLLVRQGPNIQSDFGNAAPDFVGLTIDGAQGQVRLGVDEKERDYRLVTFLAYDGQYYVSVTLQGPSRDDGPAIDAAASLVSATLAGLP